MIKVLLAGAAFIAAPAFAQTTPAPDTTTTTTTTQTAPQTAAPSTTNGIPNTALSTSPTPSDGPRAQQGDMPSNNAAAAAGGGEQPAAQPMPAPGQPTMAMPSAPVADALPAPQAADPNPPVCKAGQFTGCMEPGNHGGTRAARRRRR